MAYIVRDSGNREEYTSGMIRDVNTSKPRFDLVTPLGIPYDEQMLVRWAQLMRAGAVKYGERNWEKAEGGTELSRFRESAFRHFMQWYFGTNDVEDHAAAVLFNISGAELVKWKIENSLAGSAENLSAQTTNTASATGIQNADARKESSNTTDIR